MLCFVVFQEASGSHSFVQFYFLRNAHIVYRLITFLLYGSAQSIQEKRYEKRKNIITANLIDSGLANYLLITLLANTHQKSPANLHSHDYSGDLGNIGSLVQEYN